MLQGVIFDLDGTLLDSEHFQWQGWNEVLKSRNVSIPKEEYFDYAGKSGGEIEQLILKKHKIHNIKKGHLWSQKLKIVGEWFRTKELKPMPYAREAIEFFKNKEIKIGVASTGPRNEIELKLRRMGFYDYFDIITSLDEVKRENRTQRFTLLLLKNFILILKIV